MKTLTIEHDHGGEWVTIRLDGEEIHAGHSVDEDILYPLIVAGDIGLVEVYEIETDEETLEIKGRSLDSEYRR